MARVNVRSWRETYRGLMSDAALEDPGLLDFRERFWTAALTDERYRENHVAVAERDGELVGIAMSGPPMGPESAWARQLYAASRSIMCARPSTARELAGRRRHRPSPHLRYTRSATGFGVCRSGMCGSVVGTIPPPCWVLRGHRERPRLSEPPAVGQSDMAQRVAC